MAVLQVTEEIDPPGDGWRCVAVESGDNSQQLTTLAVRVTRRGNTPKRRRKSRSTDPVGLDRSVRFDACVASRELLKGHPGASNKETRESSHRADSRQGQPAKTHQRRAGGVALGDASGAGDGVVEGDGSGPLGVEGVHVPQGAVQSQPAPGPTGSLRQ